MKLTADLLSLGLKSLATATVLFCLARIMGKKQLSQLTYFDYVVGISIGSIAANLCLDNSIALYEGIISMIVWALFPLVLSFISEKSILGRKLLDGVPTILIQNGKILEKNLRKSKFTINDLLEELRIKDVFNIEEVEFAILETSGRISLLKKPNLQNPTKEDLNLPIVYQGLCSNLIIDGEIMKKNLKLMKLSEDWLMNELRKNNVNPKDVLLASCDQSRTLHIDLKHKDPEEMNVFI
ncbi:MAG: DUF421 domain-containing protein [Solirubrobacterales bacterium]